MTNRVILGQRGSAYGMWVSRPGKDVMTASGTDMMFDTNSFVTQIVATGVLNFSGGNTGWQTRNIFIPNLGFNPFVRWQFADYTNVWYYGDCFFKHISSTQITFWGQPVSPYYYAFKVRYIIYRASV